MPINIPQTSLSELYNVLKAGSPSVGQAIEAGRAGAIQGAELGEALRKQRVAEQQAQQEFQQKLAEFQNKVQEFKTTAGLTERQVGVAEKAEERATEKERLSLITPDEIKAVVELGKKNDYEGFLKLAGSMTPEKTGELSKWFQNSIPKQGAGLGKPMPSTLIKDFDQISEIQTALDIMGRNYSDKYTGPIGGRVGGITEMWNPEEASFRRATQSLFNVVGKLRSGGAITANEMERLQRELPEQKSSDVGYLAAYNNYVEALNKILANKRIMYSAQGYDVDSIPALNIVIPKLGSGQAEKAGEAPEAKEEPTSNVREAARKALEARRNQRATTTSAAGPTRSAGIYYTDTDPNLGYLGRQ